MDKKNIVVSICMITYNHENFIREAIEGVLMQKTDFPIELIIGEDCSTDNTRSIVLEYAAKYPDIIRPLLPDKNLGVTRNFFETLQSATGKYIALCEGDDYWTDPNKLQKQVDFLEANDEYPLVHTNGYRNINGRIKPWKEYFPNQGIIKEVFYHGTVVKTCSALLRSSFIKDFIKLYTNTNLLIGDWPLFAFYSTKGKIGYISDKTCVYRDNPNSVSSVSSKKNYLKYSLSLIEVKRFLRDSIFINQLDTIYSEDNLQLESNYALLKFYFDTFNYQALKTIKTKPLNVKSKKLIKYANNYFSFIVICLYRKLIRVIHKNDNK